MTQVDRRSFLQSGAAAGAATALAMVLVVAAALLVLRDVRRRREHARQLEEHNAELDSQVRARTAALSNLSSELQRVTEREKRALIAHKQEDRDHGYCGQQHRDRQRGF